ncbi:MAG: hypothetical protein WC389_20440 [Lutibacter sp.]|jgi:hypothetical protein
MLKNPDEPATKKQLWLLHILTKTDTRNLNITMLEASQRIEAAKKNPAEKSRPLVNPHASAIKQDKQKIAQQKYDGANKIMLGEIQIVKAYKQIARHQWEGKDGFSIDTHIFGILPRGHKAHELSWSNFNDNVTSFNPLHGNVKDFTDVDQEQVKAFIKSITDIKHWSCSPVPDDVKPIAEAKAKELDSQITIYHLINGEYVRD